MRNRTRVLIKIDGESGAQLVDNNTGAQFRILPDIAAQVQAGKKYLIYLTKAYWVNIGEAAAVDEVSALVIEGLSTENNNLVLTQNDIQKLPVVAMFYFNKTDAADGTNSAYWENSHPKDDGIICSNPFNTRLVARELDLISGNFRSFTSRDLFFELMVEEICDC